MGRASKPTGSEKKTLSMTSVKKYPGLYFLESKKHMYQGHKERTWYVKVSRDGERIEEKVGRERDGVTLESARDRLFALQQGAPSKKEEREIQAAAEAERAAQAAKTPETVDWFWNKYYKPHFSVRPKSKKDFPKQESRYNKHLKPVFGNRLIVEVTKQEINDYYNNTLIPTGLAAQTQVHILLILCRIFEHALDCEIIDKDPARKFEMPKIGDNRRIQWWKYDEMEIVMKNLQNPRALFKGRFSHTPGFYEDLHDAVFLAVMTGMREGEIVKLRWRDVKLNIGTLWAMDTKNHTTGFIPMPKQISDMLAKRKENDAEPGDLVFPTFNGKGYELSRRFGLAVDKMGWNEGIEDDRQRYTFHTLRHTYISWKMIQEKGNVPVVQQLARHKTIQMTMRYTHVYNEQIKAAVQRVNEMFVLPKMELAEIIDIRTRKNVGVEVAVA